ncbi:MAG: hypothetical protein VYE58_07675 [Pseudomonadota bacterium]|nr:hypothetical protein [Pseudomonadota bacterium]
MPRRAIANSLISATALAVALGVAAPSPAHQFAPPKPAAPAIIGLQFAQDVDAPKLAPQLDDAAAEAIEALDAAEAVEAPPVEADEPALAPQADTPNPSEEIKRAVESATGDQSKIAGEGVNPSEEIKDAVDSATGKVTDGAPAADDDNSGGDDDAADEEDDEDEQEGKGEKEDGDDDETDKKKRKRKKTKKEEE